MSEGAAGGSSDAGSLLDPGGASGTGATHWWARPGAWLLALPGLAWWSLNVAVMTSGALGGHGLGHAGWIAGRPELTRRIASWLLAVQLDPLAQWVRGDFDRAMALPAVPSVLLGLLCAGAVLTVQGGRGWRRIGAAVGLASVVGVLGALALAASVSVLEAVA